MYRITGYLTLTAVIIALVPAALNKVSDCPPPVWFLVEATAVATLAGLAGAMYAVFVTHRNFP